MIELNETDFAERSAAIQKWEHFPASSISHHNADCCQIAREWVLSMDYSQLNAGNPLAGPRWLRQKYTWGPSRWPLYWCEAVEQKRLDCGALAALSVEVFTARGVKSYPAQLIQQYSEEATQHWREKWAEDETSVHWIEENLIYHEGCAVAVGEREVRLWDPTASWWVNPKQTDGYGALLAVRIFDPQALPAQAAFKWGTHSILPNRWEKIERTRGDFS